MYKINIMKKILLLTLFIPMLSFSQEINIEDQKNDAIKSAKKWLEKIDNKKYESSWKNADILIQNIVKMEQWESIISPSREPLGKLISREILSSEYHTEMPGAPDGEYVIIIFKSSFKNKEGAIETVTPKKGKDGKWRVAGYYIR